ncbi:hypothetical protein V6N13_080630 [Hibiscus sabdariffa]
MEFSLLSFNVRGLGRGEKSRAVKRVISSCKARVIFLQETRLPSEKPWLLKRLWGVGTGNLAFSASIGASGGLITLWDSLSVVIDSLQESVIIGGDFNAVKDIEEHLGAGVNVQSVRDFANFIKTNNLVDLPLSGSKYTWLKGGSTVSASRLDRFLLSPEVLIAFPQVVQKGRAKTFQILLILGRYSRVCRID